MTDRFSSRDSIPKAAIVARPDYEAWIIVLLLIPGVFIARSFFTSLPEMMDALKKWEIAVGIANTHDFGLLLSRDHHSARWGIVLPVTVSIKLFGANLTAYYSICLAQYAVVFGLLYQFAKLGLTRWLLLPLAIFLFYEPMFFRATSQIQPFIFGVFYVVCAVYVVHLFVSSGKNTSVGAGSAVLLCLWFQGNLSVLCSWHRHSHNVARFHWVSCNLQWSNVFLLGIETLAFNSLSDKLSFGRIEFLIDGKHQTGMLKHQSSGWKEMIVGRWANLPKYTELVCICGAMSGVMLVLTRRMKRLSVGSQGIILCALSYSTFVTLIPQSLETLIPLRPLKSKYITPVAPFMVYSAALGFQQLLIYVKGRVQKSIILVAVNIIATSFLVFTFSDGYPHKYRIKSALRTIIYPSSDALFWKHG